MLPHVKNQSALSFKNFENPEHTMRTRPLSYACLLFATLCGAYFLVFFQRLSLGVIMPSLTEDLGLTPSMTGWLGSAFLYAYAATQIPAGLLELEGFSSPRPPVSARRLPDAPWSASAWRW